MTPREALTESYMRAIAFMCSLQLQTVRAFFAGRSVSSPLAVLRIQRLCDVLGILPARHQSAAEGAYIKHDEFLHGRPPTHLETKKPK